jgi:hypothetical protein
LNVAFSGESSAGKTYVALEVSAYFPEEDRLEISDSTPRSFWYDESSLIDEDHNEVPPRNVYINQEMEKWLEKNPQPTDRGTQTEWRDERSRVMREIKSTYDSKKISRFLDLHQKIIVFLDQQDDKLLKNLRPLLSHDAKQINSKIVGKVGSSGVNKTQDAVIQGYPSLLVCSASYLSDAQEQTRMLILSPEVSPEKIRAVIEHTVRMLSDRDGYRKELESNPLRKDLMNRVLIVKKQGVRQIILEPELQSMILERFTKKTLQPRSQRDIKYLISLIKSRALLNFDNRRTNDEGDVIWAEKNDVLDGFKLYEPISDSNELGLAPEAFEFYKKYILGKCFEPVRFIILKHRYREDSGRNMEHYRFLAIIDSLVSAGLISIVPDPEDGRYKCIREVITSSLDVKYDIRKFSKEEVTDNVE